MFNKVSNLFGNHRFLFEQLAKRDFTLKYKRTVLGIFWSVLSPLLNLLITGIIMSHFFGSNIDHYIVFLFIGQILFCYFTDATNLGMTSLIENASVFTKVNIPKYLFLLSKNVSSALNFLITLVLLAGAILIDGIPITPLYLYLLFPIGCLVIFNIGMGLILSALFVFFRDMQYLWGIFTQLLSWMSAIIYKIDTFSPMAQNLFLLNPMYLYIRYFRKIILENTVPSIWFHLLAGGYALVALIIGAYMYKKYNHEFLYYV